MSRTTSNIPLNPEQQHAVEAPQKPLLIVAGAGTGKTRTLTSRLLHLIEKGLAPSLLCAITFTNKAAKEMADRIHHKAGEGPFIGTFHSLGAKILRAEARELNRTPHFTIFDDNDSLSSIKKIMKELDVKGSKPPKILHYISFLKSGVAEGTSLGTREEKLLFERYEKFLERNNAFDFDDLIQKVVWLFKHKPLLLLKYQKKYEHILVDEYQDVSPGQYELIRLLAGGRNQVSVVGDDAQMIYGWRYANIETFLNFERDWPNAQIVLLEENYRSTGTIVHAASGVIAHNTQAREKNLWTRKEDGAPITLVETLDEEDEAEWIVGEVEKVNFSTSQLLTSPTIAILYRTNAQSRALEQTLLRRHIPYRIYGGLKFYERREIKDIVAGLRLAANPKDEMSRDRLEKAFRVRVFQSLVPILLRCAELSPSLAIEKFLSATDYFAHLERETMNPEERRENINELLRFAENFTDIPTFLEHISLVQSTDDVNAENRISHLPFSTSSVVHLSTVHLAKGLEFDQVFLAGCAEGILPHMRSMESAEEVEEERRLMYVGMTRARKNLSISFYGIPSRFVGEIPPDLLVYQKTFENLSEESDEETVVQLD